MKTSLLPMKAFSLVEVTLALGIISFCLLSLMALLPMWLKSVKNGNMESASAIALNGISSSIRNATTNSSGIYVASGALSGMTWSLGGSLTSFATNLTLSGQPTNSTNANLVIHVDVTPPADLITLGRASISIAWPVTATWSNNAWSKQEGFVSSGILFLPKQ